MYNLVYVELNEILSAGNRVYTIKVTDDKNRSLFPTAFQNDRDRAINLFRIYGEMAKEISQEVKLVATRQGKLVSLATLVNGEDVNTSIQYK